MSFFSRPPSSSPPQKPASPGGADPVRRQTYWDTEVTSYRRRRHGSFTWPIILALLLIGIMLALIWRIYWVPKDDLRGGVQKNGLILIEPSQPLLKYAPKNAGGAEILHQDRLIYTTMDSAQPVTDLGDAYQEEVSQDTPELPLLASPAADLEARMIQEADVMMNAATAGAARRMPATDPIVEQNNQILLEEAQDMPSHAAPSPLTTKLSKSMVPFPQKPAFVVQTSAMYTPVATEKEWHLQLTEQPHLLGRHPHVVCAHAMRGYGVLHKLYVGAFTTQAQATAFCEQLKEKEIDCFAHETPLNFSTCTFVPATSSVSASLTA